MLSEALHTPVNSALLTYGNHNADNSFLRRNLAAVEKALREKGCRAVGVSANMPFSAHKEHQIAFVYESEYGEKCWCHMPLVMWLHLIWDNLPVHYPLRVNQKGFRTQ